MGSIAFGWVDYFICFIAGLAALTGACLLLSPRWARRVALFSQINIVVACVLLAVVLGLYCIWDPTSLVRGSTGALGVIAIVVVVVMPAVFLAAVAGAQALYLSRANVKAAFEK